MAVPVRRLGGAVAMLAACLVLAGCPRLWLPHDMVALNEATDCPPMNLDQAVDVGKGIDRASDRRMIECTLEVLRQPQAMSFHPALLAARLCFLLADQEADRHRAERLGAEGMRWAQFVIAHQGEKEGAAHYYLAANLGIAVRHQVVLAVKNLGRLERELKQAVALAPAEDEGGPLRVLALLYLKAPAWPQGIGDQDKSVELLQRAIRDYPDHPANHLFYAQALWEVQGDSAKTEVREQLELTERLIAGRGWGYSAEAWRKEVRQLAAAAKLGPVPEPPAPPVPVPEAPPAPPASAPGESPG